jgi:hypothetical protein
MWDLEGQTSSGIAPAMGEPAHQDRPAGDADRPAGPGRFVFLDGWKDLCLPVPWMLEPKFAPGSAGHFRR